MLTPFWNEFLTYVENNQQGNRIIFSLLKQLKPVEIKGTDLTLSCENQGVRIYLEKKIPLIQQLMHAHSSQKINIHLIVEEKKKKNKESPLLTFQPSTDDLILRSGLHLKYKFDNYAVSSSNHIAHAASLAVAQNPGHSYNPLFLYGGVGVGKTHLAQAIGRYILEHDNEKKVFFCPGDQFTNELIDSIRERTTQKFRRKYRYLSLLIIDDIQFIAGKQTVQEEFFHTFNSIVSAGGQIALTSDRPPSDIKNLEDRLRSRFSGGLIVDVQSPDFELRTAILLIKAKEKNIEIDMEAAKVIAEQISDSRALEGTLLSIYARTLGKQERIDLDVVEGFFGEKTVSLPIRKISANDIIKAVCSYYNVKQSHLKSATRIDDIALPRQIVMYLLRRELKMKFDEIAYSLKRKDHTTIMHGVEKITAMLVKNPLLKQEVDQIIHSVSSST
ncbi:MAG: chromosomal replication initiator protein DnaA [Candidatus Roizmanbacteria bacterium]